MTKFQEQRKLHNYSQQQLANLLFVNQTAVSQWDRGVTTPSPPILIRLSELYGVSTDYLLGKDSDISPKKTGVKIPVLGRVAAGIPIEAIEDIVDYEEIDEALAATGEFFGLQIRGDSMMPRICDGDVVIVRKQDTAETGDVAVVLVNGDSATVKRIKKEPGGLWLIPYNPAYDTKVYTPAEVERLPVKIIGKVVELRGKF